MSNFKSIKKRIVFADGHHSWLKVSKKELAQLGIDRLISSHSYMRGEWAYLEEDCDVGLFVAAIRKADGVLDGTPEYLEHAKQWMSMVDLKYTDKRSRIRNYEPYEFRDDSELNRIKGMRETLSSVRNWNAKALRMINNASKADLEFWMDKYAPNIKVVTIKA